MTSIVEDVKTVTENIEQVPQKPKLQYGYPFKTKEYWTCGTKKYKKLKAKIEVVAVDEEGNPTQIVFYYKKNGKGKYLSQKLKSSAFSQDIIQELQQYANGKK